MRTSILAVALAAAFSTSCFAQTPTTVEFRGNPDSVVRVLRENGISIVEIQGKKVMLPSVRVDVTQHHGLVVLRPLVDKGNTADLIQASHRWTIRKTGVVVPSAGIEELPDHSKLVVAAGSPGTPFEVQLDTVFICGARRSVLVDGKQQEVYERVQAESPDPIIVTFAAAGAPSPPIPPTPSPPPIPSGKFGLAQFAFDAINGQTAMSVDVRKKTALSLAVGYGGVVARIDAANGNIPFNAALADVTTSGRAALASVGIDPASLDSLKATIGAKLAPLIANNSTIASTIDLRDALAELVVGFQAASK
jgi:hypothetical protein